MNEEAELKQFLQERNAALLSLNEAKIRAVFRKWNEGQEMPRDTELFWASVHKAITACTALPFAFRSRSKAWLAERGLKSLDDGDL